MAGARVGFAHGPKRAMQAIRAVHTFQMYATARPMQQSALRALRQGEAWLQETRALYSSAASMACQAVGCPKPAAGTFLFFDTQPFWKPGEDIETFLRRCVDAGVLLTPGSASGKDYARWARLCFTCLPPDELSAALTCLREVL